MSNRLYLLSAILMGLCRISLCTSEDTTAQEHLQIGIAPVSQPDDHTTHILMHNGSGMQVWGYSYTGHLVCKGHDISWPMIPARPLARKRITDPNERKRIIAQSDWNLSGRPAQITPNQYWQMAKDFNPTRYDPDKWLKAAKDMEDGSKVVGLFNNCDDQKQLVTVR